MTLVVVGAATMSADLDRVSVGFFSGDLIGGRLLLKMSTVSPSNMSSLAFAVVTLVEAISNTRILGDARYYPKPEPTVVALGYGDRLTASGNVVIEPRAYNLRWLTKPDSPKSWTVLVEADTPSGVTVPTYSPAGYSTSSGGLTAASVTGSNGNTFGRLNWNE